MGHDGSVVGKPFEYNLGCYSVGLGMRQMQTPLLECWIWDDGGSVAVIF